VCILLEEANFLHHPWHHLTKSCSGIPPIYPQKLSKLVWPNQHDLYIQHVQNRFQSQRSFSFFLSFIVNSNIYLLMLQIKSLLKCTLNLQCRKSNITTTPTTVNNNAQVMHTRCIWKSNKNTHVIKYSFLRLKLFSKFWQLKHSCCPVCTKSTQRMEKNI